MYNKKTRGIIKDESNFCIIKYTTEKRIRPDPDQYANEPTLEPALDRRMTSSRRRHRGEEKKRPPSFHRQWLTRAGGQTVVIKPKSFASTATAIIHGRLTWNMTGVQIIIVRLETLLLPLSENQVFSPRIPLFPLQPSSSSSKFRSLSLSLSLDARHSRDVSQSKRFCNASMIYCTCRDLTSESFERGGEAILLPRSPLFRSHPTGPRKGSSPDTRKGRPSEKFVSSFPRSD